MIRIITIITIIGRTSQIDLTVEHLDRMGSVSSTFSAKVREES